LCERSTGEARRKQSGTDRVWVIEKPPLKETAKRNSNSTKKRRRPESPKTRGDEGSVNWQTGWKGKNSTDGRKSRKSSPSGIKKRVKGKTAGSHNCE